MARSSSPDEFPVLKLQGLKATAIVGNGNCLFNALSDQIYGSQDHHREIRQKVVNEMREHPEEYKPFMSVNPGGGHRRNPKRKNVAANVIARGPTEAEIDANFEQHLVRMSQDGTFGDNHEIRAFTKAYNTDVVIFSHSNTNFNCTAGDSDDERPRAYIALHAHEHYSSVRNIDGPFSGPPKIPKFDLGGGDPSANAARNTVIHDWMVKSVMTALPDLANEEIIRNALVVNYGNVDNAVTYLMDLQYSSSPPTPGSLSPSQSGGSSIERDYDSDDDEIYGPNKRQNRHIRALKASTKEKKDIIPTIELTKPDAEMSNEVPVEILQPSPVKPSVHNLMNFDDSIGASDGDDEFRLEDSASEYDVSSRSPSVDPVNPRPRARVILRTKGIKGVETNFDSQNSQSSQESQNKKIRGPKTIQKPFITARQRKADKKAAQKKAATERKRAQGGQISTKLQPSTSNIARVSPPMEKVLQLGKLNMVKA